MAEQIPTLQPVSSSNVAAIGYDNAAQDLYVQWKDGRTSVYEQVPPSVASDFQNAPSPGKAFNQLIKGKYSHRYVET